MILNIVSTPEMQKYLFNIYLTAISASKKTHKKEEERDKTKTKPQQNKRSTSEDRYGFLRYDQ